MVMLMNYEMAAFVVPVALVKILEILKVDPRSAARSGYCGEFLHEAVQVVSDLDLASFYGRQ